MSPEEARRINSMTDIELEAEVLERQGMGQSRTGFSGTTSSIGVQNGRLVLTGERDYGTPEIQARLPGGGWIQLQRRAPNGRLRW